MNAKKKNDFDNVAPYYDALAKIVFGKSLISAQTKFLSCISDEENVLILGGGTGWIIEEVNKRAKNCKIYFVDVSEKMISLARKKPIDSNNTIFVHGSEKNIPHGVMYDVVITNFYFDLFDTKGVREKISLISSFTTNNVTWIVTDFVSEKWWHRIMLWIMYRFFKLTSRIEASHLPDWGNAFQQKGYSLVNTKMFFGNFIEACVFKRA